MIEEGSRDYENMAKLIYVLNKNKTHFTRFPLITRVSPKKQELLKCIIGIGCLLFMTEINISLHKEARKALQNFMTDGEYLKPEVLADGFLRIVDMIADYHEEGISLSPDVLLIQDNAFLLTFPCLCYQTGSTPFTAESFAKIVKMCAPLAVDGWTIFIYIEDEQTLKYGIVTSKVSTMSIPLNIQATEMVTDENKVFYARNLGNKKVELCSLNQKCTINLNLVDTAVPLQETVSQMVDIILEKVEVENKECGKKYFTEMLLHAMDAGHGNLIAVIDSNVDIKATFGELLHGGAIVSPKIELFKMLIDSQSINSDEYTNRLNRLTSVTTSMLNFDGITFFDNNGCVVAYHYIVNNDKVQGNVPVGGSRTRAFNALAGFDFVKACLMKSQDGRILFENK